MILFDLPIYQFVMSIFVPSTLMTVLMKFITTLGSTIVLVTGILSVAILIKNKNYFKIFVIANVVGVILNNVLKLIIHRPRPTETMLLTYESSYSFPSGHSMMSMIFYGLIIYYVIKFINKRLLRNSLVALLSLIIFSVGLSRIYLGVHYATDVIAGFIIGAVYLYIFTRIAEKKKA